VKGRFLVTFCRSWQKVTRPQAKPEKDDRRKQKLFTQQGEPSAPQRRNTTLYYTIIKRRKKVKIVNSSLLCYDGIKILPLFTQEKSCQHEEE